MEVIQIIDTDHTLPHHASEVLNWPDGIISLDASGNDSVFTGDMVIAPVEAPTLAPMYYLLAEDGTIHPVLHESELALFATNYEDDEIPAYKLDHMYARKPREPGTEAPKTVRRRVKKKEAVQSSPVKQDLIDDGPPKINIIRQRHTFATYGPVRPKILSSSGKTTTTNQSTNNFNSLFQHYAPPHSKKGRPEVKNEDPLPDLGAEEFVEYNAPSPGAVVTVCDGVETEMDSLTAHALKVPREVQYISSVQQSPTVEVRNTSVDSLGEPEDESELFFDFHMEGEVDSNIDVDFNEINPSCSVDILRDNSSSFFSRDSVVDVSILLSSDSLEEADSFKEQSHVFSEVESSTNELVSDLSESSESVPKKRGRPFKNMRWESESENPSTSSDSVAIAPVRRSSRPVKLPSRLDDMDEVVTYGKRRR